MSNFIAKAFVKITDVQKRKRIIKILTQSYERFSRGGEGGEDDNEIIAISNSRWLTVISTDAPEYIDCNLYANGDEDLAVKLFLELAQMQRFKDTNQWFKRITSDGIEYIRHSQELIDKIGVKTFNRDCFPLTPLELAEAVMRGDVKL